jgi:hypothetical protein
MSRVITLGLLILAGCPDPTNAPAAPTSQPTADGSGADGAGAGTQASGDPGGAMHTVDATVTPGEGVVLSGTISYDGEKTGRIRIDVLTAKGQNPHMLAKTLELPELGDWAIELPKDFGTVNVVGFLDQTGDGPTNDDPAMALPTPVQVGTEPVEGLSLVLSDDPDLGALTPGGPPPDGDAVPPQPDGGGGPTGQPIVGGPGDPGGPGGANPDGLPGDPAAGGDAPAAEPAPPDVQP